MQKKRERIVHREDRDVESVRTMLEVTGMMRQIGHIHMIAGKDVTIE